MTRPAPILFLVAALVAGCRTTERTVDPDTVFGHRFEREDPEGRRVMETTPPPDEEYFTYAAPITDLRIRTGPITPDASRPVELIIEGALPDACTNLHAISEERRGHLIDVRFQIRRPKGALCAQVIRPFRFYHAFAEPLPVGPYTLRVNGQVHPFEVFPEPPTDP
jgi:hypothetical protein